MMFRSLTLLCLVTVGFAACGFDDVEPEPREPISGDASETPTVMVGDEQHQPPDSEQPDEDITPEPAFPVYESIRFRRQYADCGDSVCIEELEFALRGGVMLRFQHGAVIDRSFLSEKHLAELDQLIHEPSFIPTMTSNEGFTCPPVSRDLPGFRVTLTLFVYESPQTRVSYSNDVSDCYASDAGEFPDRFVDFAEKMGRIYTVQ